MTHRSTSYGFTMVELLTAVAVVAMAASLAIPLFTRSLERIRVRIALDLLVGELYRARMTAVEDGGSVQLLLVAGADGCTRALRFQKTARVGPPLASSTPLELPGLCLRHTGDSVVAFNGRGMLRPPTRSFFISHGSTADSVVISIAGRVRRSYRRRRGTEKLSLSGKTFRPRKGSPTAKSLCTNKISMGTDITCAYASAFPRSRAGGGRR